MKAINANDNNNTRQSQNRASSSEVKRANLTSYYFKKAYENDSKVVYVNSLMPSEVFMALDLIPFNLGTIGGILSQAKAAQKFINVAQQGHYSIDLCSTCRCIMGAALENALPTPDFLVIASVPCDVGSNIYYSLSHLYKKKWFMLDVPYYHKNQEEAEAYLENQIKDMVSAIEKTLNLTLKPEKLKKSIEYSNEAAKYIQKTNELAMLIPSPLSPLVAMEIFSALHLLGSKDMADVCKERYEEIKRKISGRTNKENRKPRVLWHGLRPFYTNEIFDHLENNCQVEIISEINIHGSTPYNWEFLDPDKPFQSMAKKMIRVTGSDSQLGQTMIAQTANMIKEYSIDGVIVFNPRGCRHLLSIHQVIRDVMSKAGLPCLEIDGDYIDDRDYSFEQIKTRMDAFTELLYER